MIARRSLLAAPALLPLAARAQPRAAGPAALPLPVQQDDTVAPGYRRDVLVRWGDRVTYDAPAWNPAAADPDGASGQFGWDARVIGMAVPRQPPADGIARAVLAVAHPRVDPAFAFPDGRDRPAVAAALQGASLLNLERQGRRWVVVDGGYQSRRLGAGTLCRVTGPAGRADGARGLLAVGGGCVTPWGTLLLAEGDPAPWLARLRGVDPAFADPRSFGWMAELDPFDPTALPAKRTALGRLARGDAAATLARDGRAVVYQTERRAGGALYRFVSAGPATDENVLDAGTLAAARIEGATLRWLPLPPAVEPAAAAQAAGATPLDTPSGLGLDPRGPRLLLCCQGGAASAGQVLEIEPAAGDDGAATASVHSLLPAGGPGRQGEAAASPGASWPDTPDTVVVDAHGRAWIGTDRGGRVGPWAEGLYAVSLGGRDRGMPLALYGAPRGASIGSAALTPEGETLFVAVRHPGAEPGRSYQRPATRWPEFAAGVPPRTTLIGLTRSGGGVIGG